MALTSDLNHLNQHDGKGFQSRLQFQARRRRQSSHHLQLGRYCDLRGKDAWLEFESGYAELATALTWPILELLENFGLLLLEFGHGDASSVREANPRRSQDTR